MDANAQWLYGKALDLAVNVVSGAIVVAIAAAAWRSGRRSAEKRERQQTMARRAARVALLRSELETIISFTERCEMANSALEQFAVYQQWLVANGLLSWKQNRLVVQTWQQTTGVALQIRLGNVPLKGEVLDHLVTDMRRTDLPAPEDDNFRWEQAGGMPQPEKSE